MPSAANAKSEKPASAEATDNSPIRQVMTIIEHKIRNLEKRKSKLTSYRDLQKSGKELNSDQKVAVAKYDEVAQTLEFARDLSKQITSIATSAEREAKKQAKKEAWVRYAAETNKIREVLLILDCLTQLGSAEVRDDFLNGSNGAVKLTEEDLKILDDLYPEVTPKHEINEEGQAGFHIHTTKAAEHLYAIIDGKPKEVLGTTYAHIKAIVTAVHDCRYFDKVIDCNNPDVEECAGIPEEVQEVSVEADAGVGGVAGGVTGGVAGGVTGGVAGGVTGTAPGVYALPVPPAAAVVPPPAYPLRPVPPITLQEVEHAYFAQQYPQQRPISEVIGSQNFFFLQESEIDSPVGTPQPPPMMNQSTAPAQIPSQTFTNQHYITVGGARVPDPGSIPLPPQPMFAPLPEHGAPAAAFPAPHGMPLPPAPAPALQPALDHTQVSQPDETKVATPTADKNDDEWKESRSPEHEQTGDRKTHGQGDGQNRFRRYGRGRGTSNGFRGGRGAFQSRQGGDYQGRHERGGDYQNRSGKDNYQSRQHSDGYQSRHHKDGYHSKGSNDGYYGNGDAVDSQQQNENGGRDRYNDNHYQGGFKSRGRGGPRGTRGQPARSNRPQHYNRKPDNAE